MYRGAVGSGDDPATENPPAGPPPTADAEAAPGLPRGRPEPAHVAELAERAPFGIARLQAALFGLEVRGEVDSLPGGHYALRPEMHQE